VACTYKKHNEQVARAERNVENNKERSRREREEESDTEEVQKNSGRQGLKEKLR